MQISEQTFALLEVRMKHMTYQKLRAQMALRGYSNITLARAVGMQYNTFLRKMRCDSPFTLPEAIRIHQELKYQGGVEKLFGQGTEDEA